MANPLISVIVPCFNQAEFLSETLQSVFDQSWQNWECIIVNDGSTDETEKLALEWCSRDNRFLYFKQKNSGVSIARNAGIKIANGDFILPLDSDDLISSNYIQECVSVMLNEPETKIVYGRASFFGEKSGVWDLPKYNYDLLLSRNIIFCTALYKKASWQKCGGYDSQFISGLEDWDFWLSIINEEDKIIRVDEIMFYYRIRPLSRNSTISNDKDKMFQIHRLIYAKHIDKICNIIPSPIQLHLDNEKLQNELNIYKTNWSLLKKNPLFFFTKKLIFKLKK